MDYVQKAVELFNSGCNCAQAVFVAYCDVTGIPEKDAMRLSSSFGGGFGRLREVCGAVSGACMVLGWLYGYDTPGDDEVKKAHYARIQEMAEEFRKTNGSIICRELFGNPDHTPTPSPRTKEYYAKRPCAGFVAKATEWVEEYIEKYPR